MRKLIWAGGLGVAGVLLAGCAVPVAGAGQADPAAVYQLLHGPLSSQQVFGDYPTVDPCSLVDLKQLPGSLGAKSLPAQSLDYCPIQVSYDSHNLQIDVGDISPSDSLEGVQDYQSQSLGRSVTLLKDPDGTDFCDDYLKFSDNITVTVDAYASDSSGDEVTGLCDPVGTIAQDVYKVVSTPDRVKHRTFPANSLGRLDACSLASTSDVESAGLSGVQQVRFPAEHQCEWQQSNDIDSPRVWLEFIVDQSPSPSEPGDAMQTLSGHSSLVSSYASADFSTCSVETEGLPYKAASDEASGSGLFEIAEVYADDSSPTATQDCAVATAVATKAWTKLPST